MDWNTEGQSRNRAQATAQIAKQLLLACHSVLVIPGASDVMKGNSSLGPSNVHGTSTTTKQETPDSCNHLTSESVSHEPQSHDIKQAPCGPCVQHHFPTEERIQQKAKAKLRKAQGIAPKKRLKFLKSFRRLWD